MKYVEILSPVGEMEMCRAAVHNGADAIYVGMPGYNARGRTKELSADDLDEMIRFCHLYGVRVYIAFNIVIFQNEWEDVVRRLQEIIPLSPDGFIVQDTGLALLIRELYPWIHLNASTQMTVTSPESLAFYDETIGFERYTLAREMSLDDIRDVRDSTEKELEIFVHGALCISYSGQCFTSESFGGRSANRGECAQSCRMHYELLRDGKELQVPGVLYPVSPRDLAALADVPQLVAMGVDSLKIEGRLKSPGYVAAATDAYRRAAREAEIQTIEKDDLHRADGMANVDSRQTSDGDIERLSLTFARELAPGWLEGNDYRRLVEGSFQSHRGIRAGELLSVSHNGAVTALLERELRPGDGLLFVPPGEGEPSGGPLYTIERLVSGDNVLADAGPGDTSRAEAGSGRKSRPGAGPKSKSRRDAGQGEALFALRLASGFPLSRLREGMEIRLTGRPSLERELDKSFHDKDRLRRIPLELVVSGRAGEPLRLEGRDDLGNSVLVESSSHLQAAQRSPLSEDFLKEELSSLTNTPFRAASFHCAIEGNLFLHHREIKELRRAMVQEMEEIRTHRNTPVLPGEKEWIRWIRSRSRSSTSVAEIHASLLTSLTVLIRDPLQAKLLSPDLVSLVVLDFEWGRALRESVEALRTEGFRVAIATDRILKPGEAIHVKRLLDLRPDEILVRNPGAAHLLREGGVPLTGDFSLNVTNGISARFFLEWGFAGLTPSYDLDRRQILDLLDVTPGEFIEFPLYHHIPAFHMEYCLYARALSQGSSSRECGHVCERHHLELRDHTGAVHPVTTDARCRNTMFNGAPRSATGLLPDLLERGVRRFRLEFLRESPEEVMRSVKMYSDLLAGMKRRNRANKEHQD